MAKLKKCITCGETFKLCYSCDPNVRFSWREVACSPQCYTEYLSKINGDFNKLSEDVELSRSEEIVVEELEEVIEDVLNEE